jgi:hypothetical protein
MQDRYTKQQYPPHHDPPKKDDDCKCVEKDTATQKAINLERQTYCPDLTTTSGDVSKWEENYYGQKELERLRKCLFIWTEYNYQVIRNYEITTGTSLIQFNESIKDSTAGFLKANKTLADGLKDVVKKLKNLRDQVKSLAAAADDLKRCTNDACNAGQWGLLTGDWSKCKGGEPKNPTNPPPQCENMEDKFNKLHCIVVDGLSMDVDTLLKASVDVVGIQVFTNIATLDPIQKALYENAKAFDKQLQDMMKKDQDEVKKAQDDLVKSEQDLAKSKATLYIKRTEFSSAFETAKFFCCPRCKCVVEVDCAERLHNCKEEICEICDEVKETFCGCDDDDKSTAS